MIGAWPQPVGAGRPPPLAGSQDRSRRRCRAGARAASAVDPM